MRAGLNFDGHGHARRGFLARDEDNDYLAPETLDDEAMQQLYEHSITLVAAPALLYLLLPCSRTALPSDPHQDRKVFTLQNLLPAEDPKRGSSRVGNVAGFSLHRGDGRSIPAW